MLAVGASRRSGGPNGWGAGTTGPPATAPGTSGGPRLARSETHSPLLPCGLTEEELAAITSSGDSPRRSTDLGATAAGYGGVDHRGIPKPCSTGFGNSPFSLTDLPTADPTGSGHYPHYSITDVVPDSPSAATATGPPASDAQETEEEGDRRRSFERINRVAAAVAAEKARRRSQEASRFERPTSQMHIVHGRRPPPAARQPSGAVAPDLVLLGRKRSASEGQLDVLLGPDTASDRTCHEPVSAAQHLAAVPASHPPKLDKASGAALSPVTPDSEDLAMVRTWLADRKQATAPVAVPLPRRPRGRSAPSTPYQAAAMVEPDRRSEQGPARAAPPEPRRKQPPAGTAAAELMERLLSSGSSEAGEAGEEEAGPGFTGLEGPAAELLPESESPPLVSSAAIPYPAADPSFGNYTVPIKGAAAAAAGGDSPSRAACYPLDDGKGKPAAPHSVILRLTSDNNSKQAGADSGAETPRRRRSLMANISRLLRM